MARSTSSLTWVAALWLSLASTRARMRLRLRDRMRSSGAWPAGRRWRERDQFWRGVGCVAREGVTGAAGGVAAGFTFVGGAGAAPVVVGALEAGGVLAVV